MCEILTLGTIRKTGLKGPLEVEAKNINPYLVDAPDILLSNRTRPLCEVPAMKYGSKPSDGGNFIMDEKEKSEFLKKEPTSAKFIRPYVSGEDFIYGETRWVLWLVDAKPEELKKLPFVMERVEKVRKFRAASKAASTRDYPHHTLFRQVTQPDSDYILVPRTSSETRKYIPMGFQTKEVILSDASFAIPSATVYHFGILTSEMHMAWVRQVCGRLKSDFRYSKDIVYNNFPWPEAMTDKQHEAIEHAAQAVLDARAAHQKANLAELYDPLTMPKDLHVAHVRLDRAVDAAYGKKGFATEMDRLRFLFEKYRKLTNPHDK